MPRNTKRQPATELEAFCATCLAPEDVTTLLAKLGFHLDFQMGEQRDHEYQLPPLPAQYHYQDAHGTEAIYLAGRDYPLNEEGYPLPPHASRFWLSCGANRQAFELTASTLALRWVLAWQEAQDAQEDDEAQDAQEVA